METVRIVIKVDDCPQCKQVQRFYYRTVKIAGVNVITSYCMYCGYANEDEEE